MRNIIFYFGIFIFTLSIQSLTAQEKTYFDKLEELETQRELVIKEEKNALKMEVENINQRLESKKITAEEATKLKEEAAKKHALNIENRVAIIDNKIAILSRGTDNFSDSLGGKNGEAGRDGNSNVGFSWSHWDSDHHYDNRTELDLVLAFGFNNALRKGQSINDSDFKVGGSRFFELGLAWRTRVFQNSNWLRFKYGFSFQFNGLKPTDNRYFVTEDNMTELEVHSASLNKSKYRMDNLVFPIHFEFGPSTRTETEERLRFSTKGKLKIGLGAYAGLNIGDRQKLKYEEEGEKIKRKLKGDYNTNEFIYGLSGYIGWGGTAAYVKYDLNPIFESPNAELNNISVGLRFDMD